MDNIALLRFEIVLFFVSLWYIFYYLLDKIIAFFVKIKNIIKPDRTALKEKIEQIIENNEELKIEEKKSILTEQKNKLSASDNKKIVEMLKRVQLNISKWYLDSAKSIIVEWLAIDKNNKDLNIELAKLYESEKNYLKAEYIYKDLLLTIKSKFEILKKLGLNLAMQQKYSESIEYFTQAHNKKKDDNEVIEYLVDLNYEIKNYKETLKYVTIFLIQFPRNIDKIMIKADCLEITWQMEDSLNMYKKALELQPYSSVIREKVASLAHFSRV